MSQPTVVLVHGAFAERAPAAAWRTRPSWGIVSTSDHTTNPEVQRFAYQRAGVDTVEVNSSHLMLSHPAVVAEMIRSAVESVPV
ncbi:alpha/beta hydrolase [Frankia sp. Mgl5]|nr:alpha/beta hydrolase [Frankia sp. Mgl5]MCK9927684.1 alpha/beta hydrolase [Frankia sp. Mgl5]